MVIWLHLILISSPSSNSILRFLAKTSFLGQLGVDLFFVLSGFLITRILLNSKEQGKYFRNFYARRMLRIFPLYYGFLAVYFLIGPSLWGQVVVPARQQAWFWLYLQNVAFTFNYPASGPNHFWSLAVEEHFYLFWPFLVYYCRLRALLIASLGIILLALFSRVFLLGLGYGVFYFTLCRMDSLAVGCILAILERQSYLDKCKRYFIIGLVALGGVLMLTWSLYGNLGNPFIQVIKLSLIPAFFACVIGLLLVIPANNLINRIVGCRLLTFTGSISYSMYVLQGLGFAIASYWMASRGWLAISVTAIASIYLIAYISYELYEKPFLKLKRNFEYGNVGMDSPK